MFKIEESPLQGCFEVQPKIFSDPRGKFVKIFHFDEFKRLGLETDFREEYYSSSLKWVIRGLHFQTPPNDHAKIVFCVRGEVLDVLLDLRKESPTYGRAAKYVLNEEKGNFLYIPKGIAHGFCVLSSEATLVYKVSSVHNQASDAGILWSSVQVEWPTSNPIMSERDLGFPELANFESPFIYE